MEDYKQLYNKIAEKKAIKTIENCWSYQRRWIVGVTIMK